MSDTDKQIRVSVVDDHPLFREGVASIFSRSSNYRVVALGGSKSDALEIAKDYLPDVMLLDIRLPGNGLNAVSEISALFPAVKIIMLTSSEDERDVSFALSAGARGYLMKGVGGKELLRTVDAVHDGETYVSPHLAARLLIEMKQKTETARTAHAASSLTHREDEILEQVAEGLTNKEIAAHFSISEKTVKHYMTNIMQKLQVRNRVEAALTARARRKLAG